VVVYVAEYICLCPTVDLTKVMFVCFVHGSGRCCVHRGSLCLLFSFAS